MVWYCSTGPVCLVCYLSMHTDVGAHTHNHTNWHTQAHTQAHTGTHRQTQENTGTHSHTQAHIGTHRHTQAHTLLLFADLRKIPSGARD